MSAVPLPRHNLDFAYDVLHLADLGFKQISVEPVVADRIRGVRTAGRRSSGRSSKSMTSWQQRW